MIFMTQRFPSSPRRPKLPVLPFFYSNSSLPSVGLSCLPLRNPPTGRQSSPSQPSPPKMPNGQSSLKSIGRILPADKGFGNVQREVLVVKAALMVILLPGGQVLMGSCWDYCDFEGGGWTKDCVGKAIPTTL